jgi:hypothetical protein
MTYSSYKKVVGEKTPTTALERTLRMAQKSQRLILGNEIFAAAAFMTDSPYKKVVGEKTPTTAQATHSSGFFPTFCPSPIHRPTYPNT